MLRVSAALFLTSVDGFLIYVDQDLEWHLLGERNKVELVDASLLHDDLIIDHFEQRGILLHLCWPFKMLYEVVLASKLTSPQPLGTTAKFL